MSLNRKKRARSEPEESNSADDLVTPLKDLQVKKPAEPKVKRPSGQTKSSVDASDSKLEHVGTQKDGYNHWLMKSEPESRLEKGIDMKFGIEDLKTQPNQTACWDGVRNYQARNFMREMKVGQEAFFYHSNCKEPGIAGIMKIVTEAYVDHTQFDKKDAHYDAASPKDNPRWSMRSMSLF